MTLSELENSLISGNYKLYITDMFVDDDIYSIRNRENKTGTEIFNMIECLPEFVLFKTLNEKKANCIY